MTKSFLRVLQATAVGLVSSALSLPAAAQEYQLFEKWFVGIEAGWADFSTTVRLDGILGIGAELDFESDLGLGNKAIPAISAGYKPGRRHQLNLSYFDAKRDSTRSAATEFRFGDIVVPIDVDIRLEWEASDLRVGYAYFPMIKPRTALGVGAGLRVQDLKTSIVILDTDVSESADVVGPLPFIWVEVRHGLTPKIRLTGGLGILSIKFGDFEGSQTILEVGIQHQTTKTFAFGARIDLASVDVDVTDDNFSGSLEQDVFTVRVFAKARFGKTDYN